MATIGNPRVHLINSKEGDWQGLYIDGALVDEGHSLDLKACMIYIAQAGIGPNDIEQIDDVEVDGSLPDNIEDLDL